MTPLVAAATRPRRQTNKQMDTDGDRRTLRKAPFAAGKAKTSKCECDSVHINLV